MPAGNYNLVIEENCELVRTFIWKDSDGDAIILTNCTLSLKCKTPKGTDILDLDESSPEIIIDGPNGSITVKAPIGTLPHDGGTARWQLDVTVAGGSPVRLLRGEAILSYGV